MIYHETSHWGRNISASKSELPSLLSQSLGKEFCRVLVDTYDVEPREPTTDPMNLF